MSEERYIQKVVNKKEPKKEKKKEERVLTKPGEYSQIDLEKAAKIYSPMGGKY
tara:strand:- start:2518 stop:2676 length:159 start_codon:yes stop_codon:yes gene_type:complete